MVGSGGSCVWVVRLVWKIWKDCLGSLGWIDDAWVGWFSYRSVGCSTTIVTFFETVNNPKPMMEAKLNYETHIQKTCFVIFCLFVRAWLES